MQHKSLRLQRHLGIPRVDAWDLLLHPKGQKEWLGPDSRIHLCKHCRNSLCDEAGVWREASIERLIDFEEVNMSVIMAPHWNAKGQTSLRISLYDYSSDSSCCVLIIEEHNIPKRFFGAVEMYWMQRLSRLTDLICQIQKRRESPRQAVILIHGIGEQQPGEILNAFITSGVLGRTNWGAWIKPDSHSDLLDLRMATLSGNKERPTTDVYEVYWAHLIRDTTLMEVAAWVRRLLLRRPVRVRRIKQKWKWDRLIPPSLTPIWILTWVITIIMPALALWSLYSSSLLSFIPYQLISLAVFLPAILFLLGLFWKYIGQSIATDYLGDAASYLRPHPSHIEHRQAICSHGVRLLEEIHRDGRYDRIVVVGHSLGSVIAYDILTYAWNKLRRNHQHPSGRQIAGSKRPFQSLRKLERLSADKATIESILPIDAQKLQHEAWKELRINTQPWLVTDLVTVGSPLTYADFLLADSSSSLHKQKRNRTIPICPPWMEKVKPFGKKRSQRSSSCPKLRFSYEQSYSSAIGAKTRTFTLYNQAALFAVTRWTNIHIPSGLFGLTGDVISGPLGAKRGEIGLGKWILDVKLDYHFPHFMHTWYWDKREGLLHLIRRKREQNKQEGLTIQDAYKKWQGNILQKTFRYYFKNDNLDSSRTDALKAALKLDSRKELEELLNQIPAYQFIAGRRI